MAKTEIIFGECGGSTQVFKTCYGNNGGQGNYTSGTQIECGFSPSYACVEVCRTSDKSTLAFFKIDFTTSTMEISYNYNGAYYKDAINSLNYNSGVFAVTKSGTKLSFTSSSTYLASGVLDLVAYS